MHNMNNMSLLWFVQTHKPKGTIVESFELKLDIICSVQVILVRSIADIGCHCIKYRHNIIITV